MIIPFGLPQVFHPNASKVENAEVLAALLESLVLQNGIYRRYHSAPLLYKSGVVYGRTLEWENIAAVQMRRYGDCKSVSAWLVSDYRHVLKIPAKAVFRFVDRDDGGRDFHILVQTPPGKVNRTGWECPSKVLGMNREIQLY